jgi:hypothetical protein
MRRRRRSSPLDPREGARMEGGRAGSWVSKGQGRRRRDGLVGRLKMTRLGVPHVKGLQGKTVDSVCLEKQNVNKNHKILKIGGKHPKSKKFLKF